MPETPVQHPEIPQPIPETAGRERADFSGGRRAEVLSEQPEETVRSVRPIPVPTKAPAPLAPAAAPLQQHVEEVMSSGLADTYARLDPATQQRFRAEGEVTAGKISTLLQSSKVQVKKIVDLLVAWLRIIPGVNSFFLEQEAKIKADKILALKPRE